jgi:membrane fusion protein, multidrug efflux system
MRPIRSVPDTSLPPPVAAGRARLPFLRALPLILLPFLAACGSGGTSTQAPSGGVPVRATKAVSKDVPVQVREIGTVEAYSTVEVKAQVGGQLEGVHFKEGQDVRRGQLLFTLDARPYAAALKEAEAALARDTVQLKNAQQDVARYKDLVAKDYVTQEEFDRIRTNAESLQAAVQADEASVENARVQLEYCTIHSPLDGRTGQLVVHRGNLVKANADTPMVVINQTDPVYVAFSVPEIFLPEIKARQGAGHLDVIAEAPGAAGDPPVGRLSFIDNSVDNTTGTVLLKATFANQRRALWPGQFVNVRLGLSTRHGAITVPSEAIQTGQQGPYLFVIGTDGTAVSRPVILGPAYEHETVVEKGVEAGETVVTDGQIRLVPGTRVEILPDGESPTPPAAGDTGA